MLDWASALNCMIKALPQFMKYWVGSGKSEPDTIKHCALGCILTDVCGAETAAKASAAYEWIQWRLLKLHLLGPIPPEAIAAAFRDDFNVRMGRACTQAPDIVLAGLPIRPFALPTRCTRGCLDCCRDLEAGGVLWPGDPVWYP